MSWSLCTWKGGMMRDDSSDWDVNSSADSRSVPDDLRSLREELEREKIRTDIAALREKQAEHNQRRSGSRLANWGRGALMTVGLLTTTMGLSDAVLPDDPEVLRGFPPIVTILTAHEGDALKTIVTGSGMMVPVVAGRRKAKASGGKKQSKADDA